MSSASEPLVAIDQLSKSYGGVRALHKVSLEIRAGEVHGLCGENGAGKSTLIRCLSGVVIPDAGSLTIEQQPLPTGDISATEQAGIAVIHQESTSFPDLDLVENLFVGREANRFFLLDRKAMEARAREVMQRLGLQANLRTPLREFSIAQRRMVEMARALLQDCRLLIMDEPTASLSARETKTLLNLVRQLRDDGISVLYVSHRLEEIADICDRVTVLRDGQVVATNEAGELTKDELIRQMVGREVEALTHRAEHTGQTDQVRVGVKHLSAAGRFSNISFEVHGGEILGIGGLIGAGRTEVARAVFGADRYDSGSIEIDGTRLPKGSIRAAIDAGVAFVPEDRQHEGLILEMSVAENLSMAVLQTISRHGLISTELEDKHVAQLVERLAVRTSGTQTEVSTLSGGNQQKVLLGKWLATAPALLIIDEPTRGVDIGAKVEIHRLIRELTSNGMATVVITSDLPELLTLSDRILVMCDGQLTAELDAATADEEQVMRYALPGGEDPS